MNPVFLKIGPIELHYYGLMYAIAFFVGISLGKKIAKERNFDVDLVENYAFAFRSLQETMQTFREELITLDELKEKKDYVAYVSTLDYCISDILENFKTNIDYYCKNILEDLEQKKIIF